MQETEKGFKAIAHYSRTLSISERNWDATHLELAAIVWSLRNFHVYVFNAKLVIHSDHKALSYLSEKKTMHSNLLRWAMELQPYLKDIVHIQGEKNLVADALSRIPEDMPSELYPPSSPLIDLMEYPRCLAIEPANSEKPILINAQREDEILMEVIKILENPQTTVLMDDELINFYVANCELKDNILMHVAKTDQNVIFRPVIPFKLRKIIFETFHDSRVGGGHMFSAKTLQKCSRYFWPNMSTDIKNWCKNCEKCQARSSPRINSRIPLVPWKTTKIFQIVGLDLCGPFKLTNKGNRHIMNMVCHFSKYIVSVSLPDARSETIAKAILENLILIHGAPISFLSDNARYFSSEVFKTLTNLMQIQHLQTVTYRSISNGVTEISFRTFQSILSKFLTSNEEFDDLLPAACFCYNTSKHSTTGETPFYLIFGRDPIFPAELILTAPRIYEIMKDTEVMEFRAHLTTTIRTAWARAFEHSQEAIKKFAFEHDKKSKNTDILIGDVVLLRRDQVKPGFSPKFKLPWKGTFRVVKIQSPHAWIISVDKPDSEPQRVHINQIKPYFGQFGPACSERPNKIDFPNFKEQNEETEISPPTHDYNLRSRKVNLLENR